MPDCTNSKHVQSNYITFKENIQLFQSMRTRLRLGIRGGFGIRICLLPSVRSI